MDGRYAKDFGDEYTLVTDTQDIDAVRKHLGLVFIPYKVGSLFVRVEDGDYQEVWGSYSAIPYTHLPYGLLYTPKKGEQFRHLLGVTKSSRPWHCWCVLEGLDGLYTPDTVNYFTSKREAMAFMADAAKDIRDYGEDIEGNASDGYLFRKNMHGDYIMSITLSCETFPTRAARDAFIAENEDC